MSDTIEGLTITAVRHLTPEEMEAEGWEYNSQRPVICLELSDGSLIYPSRDAEGNGPGELFGQSEGKTIIVQF